MADEKEVAPNESVEAEKVEAPNEGEGKGNKNIIFIILGVVLLVGGGAGYYFGFYNKSSSTKVESEKDIKSKENAAQEEKVKQEEDTKKDNSVDGKLLYYNLPEITANLRSKNGFVKISLILEYYNKPNEKLIEEKIPLIVDQLQLFIRDLQKEDFLGTAMLTKLKETILIRINNILAPVKINAILLRDLLVQ